jgi:hypothetical protein
MLHDLDHLALLGTELLTLYEWTPSLWHIVFDLFAQRVEQADDRSWREFAVQTTETRQERKLAVQVRWQSCNALFNPLLVGRTSLVHRLREEKWRDQTDVGAGEVSVVLRWELAGVSTAVAAVRAFARFSARHGVAGVTLRSSGFEFVTVTIAYASVRGK